MADLETSVRAIALAARKASAVLARTTTDQRNAALLAMARALREHSAAIVEANAEDMRAGRAAGMSEGLLDRLELNEQRVEGMASALEDLASLSDPVGRVLEERTIEGGMLLQRISVPLGVVAMVYEARPNVTADAAGICLKSGNACILRGGSMAARSCAAIARVLSAAAEQTGMPEGSIGIVASTDRAATDVLMGLHGLIDVLVPRGGAGLIRHCVETAKVPVIETGTGNCHVYVHESADFDMAREILVNAKCRRFGVCNACETLLVDASIAADFLPKALSELADRGVAIHADEPACEAALAAGALRGQGQSALRVDRASEQDWETEYLGPEIAVKCVAGVDEAIAHVNRYGTMHSEAIVANPGVPEGAAAIERFLNEVDAAAVYANASTAFTDGGMFGLGAEIGISTQKLHVRGPFATDGLTSYKYVLRGDGQVRP